MGDYDAGEPLLAVERLSLVRGGRQLFSDLSLCVTAGQFWMIEGANGAGKTSLLRILAGLSRYGFEGRARRTVPMLYLGHHSAVKPLLSPRENLSLHPAGAGDYDAAAIDRALAEVGLYGYEDVPSRTLSAGQHRRVNLARLYLSSEPLWILDEPFTAIDKTGVAQLETRLAAHVSGGGAVVLTSHQALSVDCEVQRLGLDSGTMS
ncbi:MAG: cytochrome c biogenesis heme-transporting ATPase CcmA [Halioglobus sp.]|nr:cytochrome c biogenesis heme-transporting ATPase CcmA [Halioglobus sp.]